MLEEGIRPCSVDSDRRRPADHDGQHDRSEALLYYFRRWKIRFLKPTCCGSSKSTSGFVFEREKDRDSETGRRRLIPSYCFASFDMVTNCPLLAGKGTDSRTAQAALSITLIS